MFIFISTYLFVYLLISILFYCFYLVIIVTCCYPVSRYIFVHGYMKSSQIPIFTGNQQKRSHTKQVLKLHILCNYVSKENSYVALPKIKMLFSNHTFLL